MYIYIHAAVAVAVPWPWPWPSRGPWAVAEAVAMVVAVGRVPWQRPWPWAVAVAKKFDFPPKSTARAQDRATSSMEDRMARAKQCVHDCKVALRDAETIYAELLSIDDHALSAGAYIYIYI